MPPHQLNKAQRVERERRIWERYQKGDSLTAIAVSEDVSHVQIAKIVRRVLDRVRGSLDHEVEASKARQLAGLRRAQVEAWAAWERSQKPKGRGKKKRQLVPLSAGGATVAAETHEDTVEGQTGNPAYLRLALEAMAAEAKLLGLNEPDKHDHTLAASVTVYDGDLAAMHRRFDEILRTAAVRALAASSRPALPAAPEPDDAPAPPA